MATWPSSLGNPQFSGYDLETTDPTIRTDMEGGSARVRRRYTAAPDTVSLKFLFDTAQMATFRAFWDYDMANGAAWVYMPIKTGYVSGLESRECRPINGRFKSVPVSATHCLVEFQVEVRRGVYVWYDTINAMKLPSLELDFAGTQSLNSVLTSSAQPAASVEFSRSSVATYIGSDGLIKTAAVNEARFDFDPVTRVCKGLLIEEARKNLLLNSETLSTQTITVTAAARTLSFYGTGTVVLSGAHSATVAGLGAFPIRTSYTYTPSAGSLTLTVTGSVTFANDELGAFATSYIPTTTAQATRAAEIAQMTGANLSSWYRQDEGTFIVVVTPFAPSYSIDCQIVSANDNSSNNYIVIQRLAALTGRFSILTGGVVQMSTTLGYIGTGIKSIAAIAYKLNNSGASLNGSEASSDAACTVPAVSKLNIGTRYDGYRCVNGHIARLTYYPKRLSNAELQALSA